MPFNPFSALTSKIYGAIAAVALLVAAVQTARIEGFLFWQGLKAENADLREAIEARRQAQELAQRIAEQEKARIEAENERKADEAREMEANLRADYDARLARWLRAQSGGSAVKADLPGPAQGVGGIAETCPAAELPQGSVAVPIADLELSALAFSRLEALQAWARSVAE